MAHDLCTDFRFHCRVVSEQCSTCLGTRQLQCGNA
jgi:hypothetical protein